MNNWNTLSKNMLKYLQFLNIKPDCEKLIQQETVHVYIIDDVMNASLICSQLKECAGGGLFPELPILGFDTETYINRPQSSISFQVGPKEFKTGSAQTIPSMIQIAISHHIIFIFRCYKMCVVKKETGDEFTPMLFPKSLSAILSSPNITKIGVAASRDAQDIDTYFNTKCTQILDLDVLAKGLGLPKQSLAALTYMYCDTTLSKKWGLLNSKWDGPVGDLSDESIWYASNDALYALKIFEKMVKKPTNIPDTFPDFDGGFARNKKSVWGTMETKGKLIRGPFKPKNKGGASLSTNWRARGVENTSGSSSSNWRKGAITRASQVAGNADRVDEAVKKRKIIPSESGIVRGFSFADVVKGTDIKPLDFTFGKSEKAVDTSQKGNKKRNSNISLDYQTQNICTPFIFGATTDSPKPKIDTSQKGRKKRLLELEKEKPMEALNIVVTKMEKTEDLDKPRKRKSRASDAQEAESMSKREPVTYEDVSVMKTPRVIKKLKKTKQN